MIREKRQFSFLLPAILTAALVFHMLPQTQMMLRAIPERLQLVAEAGAKESPVKRRTADGGNGAETLPAAEGTFEDGVYTGSSSGYGGDITVQVTVENSRITDVRILSAPGETEPYFSLAASLLDTVKQAQSWEVDTVSGATYSSRGILGAIRNALTGETVENEKPESVDPVGTTSQDIFKDPAAYKDGTYYGTADGFGGPITVEVVIKDGKIASIRVVSAPDETGDYLSRAKGVLSRILKKGSPNVDSISGATYSSTGIINAVKRALSKAASDGKEEFSGMAESNKLKAPLVTLRAVDPAEYEDGTYYGTADGFGGEIKVKVVIIGGKIDSILVESAPGETPKYLEKAMGVIPQILKTGSLEVDAVSGATFSSTGIIEAVRQALRQAAKDPEEGGEGGSEGGEGGSEGGEGGSEGGGTTAIRYEDGTYTGSGWCDDGEEFYYEIHISIRVADGKIASVSVAKGEDDSDSPEDNDFYLNWAVNGRTRAGVFYPGVPAQIVEKQSVEVDTVSGATYSSSTIRSVAAQVISGIPEAKAAEEEPAQENAAPASMENAAPACIENAAPKEEGEPEAPAEEEPEAPSEEEPEDSAEKEPETTTEEEPETATGEEPETTTEEEPETTTGEEPETTTGEEPKTTTGEEPETTTGEEPETAAKEEPETTDTEEPEPAGSGETGGNGS